MTVTHVFRNPQRISKQPGKFTHGHYRISVALINNVTVNNISDHVTRCIFS